MPSTHAGIWGKWEWFFNSLVPCFNYLELDKNHPKLSCIKKNFIVVIINSISSVFFTVLGIAWAQLGDCCLGYSLQLQSAGAEVIWQISLLRCLPLDVCCWPRPHLGPSAKGVHVVSLCGLNLFTPWHLGSKSKGPKRSREPGESLLGYSVGKLHSISFIALYSCALSLSRVWLQPHGLSPPGSSVHGTSSGKNTGVGCHALLQGMIPTQGPNPGLPHCRQNLYWLSHQHCIN